MQGSPTHLAAGGLPAGKTMLLTFASGDLKVVSGVRQALSRAEVNSK
jgi:hypothetical protein